MKHAGGRLKSQSAIPNPKSAMAERLKTWLISQLGYWSIRILCLTLRWEVDGWENLSAIEQANQRIIYTFWHGRIFLATYFFRNRGIVVMTSQNRDGEYIARVIRRFGYGAARGSSSRGGRRALVEMIRQLRHQHNVGFAIDGPRGPRYVAKPGAVWIASKTGSAIFPFHIAPEKKWILRSWDHFQIPKPFSRTLVLMAPAIYVKADAGERELEIAQQQLQTALDELLIRGDSRWNRQKTA
jgi:lysophospholipid acyltransferase (LPLAT)-like uncharacterized protein